MSAHTRETSDDDFYPPPRWRGTKLHYLICQPTGFPRRFVAAEFNQTDGRYYGQATGTAVCSAEDLRRHGYRWHAPIPSPDRCVQIAEAACGRRLAG